MHLGQLHLQCYRTDVKTPSRGFYVDIGKEEVIQPSPGTSSSSKQSEERKIWTVVFNEIKLKDGTVPLVMVHGLCASIGLWSINIDDLSKDRAVYTIDLLGMHYCIVKLYTFVCI